MKRAALSLSLLVMLARPAAAQQADKKPAAAAPPPATAPQAPAPAATPVPAPLHAGAILHVAHEIAQGMGQVPAGAIVVASPIASDIPAPKADELAVRIAAQVAGRIGVAKAHPQPAALAVARGLSGRAASLVYLQLEIAKGELRVTADLYPVVSNGWERLRNPVPGPRAHAFAMAPLDAEIRGFLVPVLLEQTTLHKVKHDEGEVLAVGCGDVDGDGGLELVLVSRARVAVAKIRAGKLVVQRTAAWSTIASRAPVPMRDPLATVLVSPRGHRGEILVGTTDRGGVAVDAALVARRALTGLPVPGAEGEGCAGPSAETSAYEGNVLPCDPPVAPKPPAGAGAAAKAAAAKPVEPLPLFLPPAPRYDAIATLDAVARDGSVSHIVAVREPGGKLHVRRQDLGAARPIEATLEGVGAQLAVVDLDLDGTPEIVTTSDGPDDVMVVSSFAKGVLSPRLRFPAKEGVRAIGVCPPEERGVPGLVAVVGSEVWLVR
ncbi:MAG: hypothetical protein JWP87_4936 [Labilithrix sp.]|nr:hypothetical protein [Labilithrix sp.]